MTDRSRRTRCRNQGETLTYDYADGCENDTGLEPRATRCM